MMAPRLVALLSSLLALASACPCCPTCMPAMCPCACPTCGTTPAPGAPTPAPVAPTPAPATVTATTTAAGPLLECKMNCYGEAATSVPLPGGDGNGVEAGNVETCRDYCFETAGCEAIVFGQGMCWGKKDIRTSKCAVGGDFVTEMLTRLPYGTCTLMGDPHVLAFDNANGVMGDITQLQAGDYVLVQSDELIIHARFGYSARFPAEASTTGVAVGGSLIQGNKLVVEYVGPEKGHAGFKAYWNDVEILNQGFPASYDSPDGVLHARLSNMEPTSFHAQARHTIGGEEGELPSYLFELAPGIRVYMLLGEETANVVLNLRKLTGGMDGYCGNFNCIPEDDTLPELEKRGLAAPLKGGSLFSDAPPAPASQTHARGKAVSINDCSPSLLAQAEEACKTVPTAERGACQYDVCACGSSGCAKEDVAAAALTQEMGEKFGWFAGLRLPRLVGAGAAIPVRAQWGAAALLVVLVVGGMASGWATRRGRRLGGRVGVSLAGDVASAVFGGAASGAGPSSRVGEAVEPDEEEALLQPAASEYDPIQS